MTQRALISDTRLSSRRFGDRLRGLLVAGATLLGLALAAGPGMVLGAGHAHATVIFERE